MSHAGNGSSPTRPTGDIDVVGPVRLPCAVRGRAPVEFEFNLFTLPPESRYTVMALGSVHSHEPGGPLVRIASACIWSHLFSSVHCDCGEQLELAKAQIVAETGGVIVYCHDQHGKGVGLRNHFVVYAEGQRNHRELVVKAYEEIGFREDYRDYADVSRILSYLGITQCRLLTNDLRRVRALEATGLRVIRVPLAVEATAFNAEELEVKKTKLGHLI